MWIIRLALGKPYTFFVLAIAILLFGPLAILRTPIDIFPDIRLPVVSVVWTYNGLPPSEFSDRIITYFERQMTTAVNDIDHIESQSLPGVGVINVFFHPNVRINGALAQVTSIAQTVLRRLPPGITRPQILAYNASSVPILQLALSSPTLSDQQLYDLSNNFIRPQLAEVEGAAVPSPYGGKARQVMVDIDPNALHPKNLSPADITSAILAQNLILPSGTAKVGAFEYNVRLNASPTALDELNDLPVKSVDGATIYLRDVAHVRDGYSPQQNLVRVDGHRSVLTTIQKNGSVSTLDVISHVKALLPKIKAGAPPELNIDLVGEQAPNLALAAVAVLPRVPDIPVGVPSTLVERRPDVAAAERRTAAANTAIGVARAAYFPRLTLTAAGGYESTGAADWLSAPNRLWAVGPAAALMLFDTGTRHAEVARAQSALTEATERYRATVLSAFQEVADNLALLDLLRRESTEQQQAATAAARALELATNRYTEGAVNYLDVVVAQASALQADRAVLNLQVRQLTASVGLIRGLGGGWREGDLPSSHDAAALPHNGAGATTARP